MARNRGTAERELRVDVRRPAIVVNSDGMEIDAILLDISSHGFRVELDDQLRIGELVKLRVGNELANAEVRWVLGKEAGGTFLSPVDPASL